MKKVLIANRGEIAVRIARALAEANIRSVAIYSEADTNSHHVRVADEAYPVGPSQALQSYLDAGRILDVAKKCGADAVHPGYGFLSENAEFAEACSANNVIFIGPPASAIKAMGQKISAREIMQNAGVPVVPGGDAETLDQAIASAARVGYPVMLKPSGGGGGKGMRRVESQTELSREWASAKQEAERSFSDGTMYIEKCLLAPRHVEIQVLGDQQGNVVHLFERDCSLQRRHQKIVEEAPSTALTPELSEQMGATSVKGAQALGYYSAGTFEYLLENGSFYFLEMNTRLQVEHGVTELLTGIDLVQQMLRIAQGQALSFDQGGIARSGHAIECRIYAESPEQGFLPSPGTIERLVLPQGPGIRNDEGAQSGDAVSGYYDPLIAKLLAFAGDREACRLRMRRALNEYVVDGLNTNLPFLRRVVAHDSFARAEVDTSFITTHPSLLQEPTAPTQQQVMSAAAAAAVLESNERRGTATHPAPPQASEWLRQHRIRNLR